MSWDDAVDGVDRDTPGGRMPRAWTVAARLRAANDDIAHAMVADGLPAYAELHCLSDFSFLRGASSAEQLFMRAHHCGYSALAITDECSLAGIVRGLEASRATGVRLIVGSEFTLVDGTRFVLLVENAHGYPQLCALITTARRAAGKGAYRLGRARWRRSFALWSRACSRCGYPARSRRPSRAPGCSRCSASVHSWRWNCTANRTMRRGCLPCSCWRSNWA
ncbi:hypothetical protein XPR_3096 [Xanthomonas arboricola pv. pruni MAFF 301420]|uniref:Polymerase/histidinol phosphatase N-terminal domain-containing protein n=1 Tax=Xanthomonas arboricola pv. pruni MAFF 301420 TaxID=1418095 RepID=W4SIY4_9XANT|nr:hypothetical protein XPR_3096 [Xanthomonas arboricola pv. pruni MAFF 301420]